MCFYGSTMNVGIYQGASAISALEQWQTAISQNIASAAVPGFKETQFSLEGLDFGKIEERAGGRGSSQSAVMPTEKSNISFAAGSFQRTGNPTDVAIGGDGFFVVQDASGRLRYTRNGGFSSDANNQLVTASGETVQGVGGTISLLPGGGDVAISSDGQIRQNGQLVGKLKVVDFDDKSALTKVSGGFVCVNDGKAKTIDNPNISQGCLEGSNVSTINQMVELIQVTRAQENNLKAIQAFDSRLQKTIQTFTRS